MIALLRWDHWWKRCRRADCRRRHSGGSPVLGHRHSPCWVPLVGAPAQSLPAVPTAPGTLRPTIHTHMSSKEIILETFVPHPACYECRASVNEETASASAFTLWARGDACRHCTMRGRGHRSFGARSRWRRQGAGSEPRAPPRPCLPSAGFLFLCQPEAGCVSGCFRARRGGAAWLWLRPRCATRTHPGTPQPRAHHRGLGACELYAALPTLPGGGHLILPGEAACLS